MNRTSPIVLCAIAPILALSFAACDDDLVSNATFSSWDGTGLTSWTLEQGSIRKAPTWHPNDYGVELLDTPTVLSQISMSSSRPACIAFSTVADVDASAQVTIGVDFNADGTVDAEQPIAATNFHLSKTLITAPSSYAAIRFVIRKEGNGRAVLAELRAQADASCAGTAPRLHDQELGTACGSDDQCASGVCNIGICSECRDDSTCAPSKCKQTAVVSYLGWFPAPLFQCNPGAHDRTTGMVCLFGDDCESGACVGASLSGAGALADAGESCTPSVDDPSCPWLLQHAGRCQ